MRLHHILASLSVVALAILACGPTAARAALVPVADYQSDFQGVTPATGWRYQHNTNGAIGNSANYVNMLWHAPSSHYNLTGASAIPIGGSFAFLNATGGHTGLGSTQQTAPFNIDRFVIAAYTVQVGDFGDFNEIGAWQLINTSINDTDTGGGLNSLELRVYVNNTLIPPAQTLPGNTATISTFNRILGDLNPGDTVYVAVGPLGVHNNDGFGAFDFTIVFEGIPVPEPSTFALLSLGVVGLAVRARRRRRAGN